jgi:hypothetical protein
VQTSWISLLQVICPIHTSKSEAGSRWYRLLLIGESAAQPDRVHVTALQGGPTHLALPGVILHLGLLGFGFVLLPNWWLLCPYVSPDSFFFTSEKIEHTAQS